MHLSKLLRMLTSKASKEPPRDFLPRRDTAFLRGVAPDKVCCALLLLPLVVAARGSVTGWLKGSSCVREASKLFSGWSGESVAASLKLWPALHRHTYHGGKSSDGLPKASKTPLTHHDNPFGMSFTARQCHQGVCTTCAAKTWKKALTSPGRGCAADGSRCIPLHSAYATILGRLLTAAKRGNPTTILATLALIAAPPPHVHARLLLLHL